MEKTKVNELKKLHKQAFKDSDGYIDFFFKSRYSKENTYIEYHNDIVISAAYARLIDICLNERKLTIPFLNGIATHKDFRNLGYATKVIEKACQNLASRGYPFVLLHPFKHSFYEKIDFTTVSFTKKIKISRDLKENFKEAKYNYRLLKKEDIPILEYIYSFVMIDKKAYNKRSTLDWHSILEEHFADFGYGYIIYSHATPIGYCLIYADDVVRELATCDMHAISVIKTLHDKFFVSFNCQKDKHTMGKVLSIKNTLYFLPFSKTISKKIIIIVESKAYALEIDKGQVKDVFMLKEPASAVITMNSKELLEIVFGLANLSNNLTQVQKKLFETYNFILFDTY